MKQLPLIAGHLYTAPWNILPDSHAEICRQFQDYLRDPSRADKQFKAHQKSAAVIKAPTGEADDEEGPTWQNDSGQKGCWHPQVVVMGSIAILPVKGIIGKHLSALEMWCGGCDSAIIAKQARNIAADERITDVIVYIDSPGGSCIGAIEAATAIQQMSAVKSSIAYTDTMAASNGYFFASACNQIAAAPSAIIGSISTYSAFLDESRAYEMEGLQIQMFRSGEVKGAGTPGKPWTDAEKAAQQLVVDQFSAQFKGFVKAQRGIADDLMQGQYWPAEFAPAGLVDVLYDDLESLVADLRSF